ncbi:MAG: threonine/serine exporter ThrE family protein [Faecalibacillus sp.]
MNNELLLKNISEIGLLLLKHGAEIYRVEESLQKMCECYGFRDIGVFALPSYFTLSVTFQDGTISSLTKRTTQNRTNLDAVYELNNLVRYICDHKPDNQYIEKEIKKIKEDSLKMYLVFLGYGIGAGSFAIFFGGGFNELIAAAFIGFCIYFFIWLNEVLNVNAFMRTMLTSMLITVLSILMFNYHLINNLDATIIGSLMILVPGIAITNSLRDIIDGNYLSGQARLFEAFFIAMAIAAGVGFIRVIMGGVIL